MLTQIMFLFFLTFFAPQCIAAHHHRHHHSNFTATLFFGDSTLDTGNNKFIRTVFLGNHYPYGISSPNMMGTGRFSNGLLVPDLLTSALGIKSLAPPWLDPQLSDKEIKTGVNFASAGAGYDEMTSVLSKTLPVSTQVAMFGNYVSRLKGMVGEEEGTRVLENALVLFSAGGNDVIFNYYDLPTRRKQFNMDQYQDFLLGKLVDSVKKVYSYGCRKFIIAGLPPIGCLPVQITATFGPFNRQCIDQQISETVSYNKKLQNLLPKLQKSLSGSKLAYLDISDNILSMFEDSAYGFEETKKGCCGSGLIEMGPLCNHLSPLCEDISSYAFFDAIHPSEKVYRFVTDHIMKNVIHKLY